ncbi:MAG TPA: hypothetical protein VLW50_19355 [Streptosporangiaceae bacterium]|nr:hypothetical protein [Streptosporangiaceae bacterium]
MAEPAQDRALLLREDLSKEYYAILNVVSNYDGWLLIVKGWSVTLSLAALGLGFQQKHFALFALAAVTGSAFWFLDGLMKGYQYRYYVRMREIEYTAYLINRVPLGGKYGDKEISAPRIDMTWGFKGYRVDKDKPPPDHDLRAEKPEPGHDGHADEPDWRADEPWRRSPQDIYSDLRGRFWWANVALPHAVAVALGAVLFIAAALNAPGLEQLHL